MPGKSDPSTVPGGLSVAPDVTAASPNPNDGVVRTFEDDPIQIVMSLYVQFVGVIEQLAAATSFRSESAVTDVAKRLNAIRTTIAVLRGVA